MKSLPIFLIWLLLLVAPISALSIAPPEYDDQWDYPYRYQSSGYWRWHPYSYPTYYQPYSGYRWPGYSYYRPYYQSNYYRPSYYYHPWRWSDRRYW
ncbi:MAG TPA: hypothetical protein VJG90_08590 [Candidatus Nanoarchaeia archaeon]|nr:hypothetical protein [Candidatus Nanoarchaeia archaeon]